MQYRQFLVSTLGLSLALVGGSCRTTADAPSAIGAGEFEREMESVVDGQRLSYLLHVPAPESMPDAGWPMLLFLHGAGERGDDLSLVRVHGPPKLIADIPELTRCVLVSPQCPADEWWQPATLKGLIDEVQTLAAVDPERIYVSGLSMGGYGTWALLARYPELFAAAIPICGGGDVGRLRGAGGVGTGFDIQGLLRARNVPIHAFHGEADSVVPAQESRLLVQALEAVDGDVRLTVYLETGHDSWTRTYADKDIYRWLFDQRRAGR